MTKLFCHVERSETSSRVDLQLEDPSQPSSGRQSSFVMLSAAKHLLERILNQKILRNQAQDDKALLSC
jgi:hypothetical protein